MEYSRSRTSYADIPKPETGLAEWTSKIKALQREVDADEEAEQRRLEEEIKASRLARMSRRAGRSVDLSKDTDLTTALMREDSTLEDLNRQRSQADALRRLAGSSPTPSASSLPSPAPARKPEPMSLATFMGGRGSGPRLNKHAPQQDAHDPTKFEQRTHISVPHPVFGRGGVAMPGMTRTTEHKGREWSRSRSRSNSTSRPDKDRTTSTPGVARRYIEKLAEEKSTPIIVVPQRTGSAPGFRERRMSTPSGVSPARSVTLNTKPDYSRRPVSQEVAPETRPKTPLYERQPPISNLKTPPSSPPPFRSYTPRQRPISPHISSPSSKSALSTPSLARSILPDPKLSPQAPQIPVSKSPSLAFLRSPTPKDPTPSISRLQGRGFVQAAVKASSQLEASTTGTSSPDRRVPGERRKSVLERWQPTTPVTPPISPSPAPSRKPKAVEVFPVEQAPIQPVHTGRSLKSVASMPSMNPSDTSRTREPKRKKSIPQDMRAEGAPNLGSSSTMISYIKPMKTGDDPLPPPAEPLRDEVDELGVRAGVGGGVNKGGITKMPELSSPPRTALSHPTKDRARKPRKHREVTHEERQKIKSDEAAITVSGESSAKPSPSPKSAEFLPKSQENVLSRELPRIIATSPTPQHVNTGRVVDRWLQDGTIIGVKSIKSTESKPTPTTAEPNGMVSRRALPGMASASSADGTKPTQVRTGLAGPANGERKPFPGLITTPSPFPTTDQKEEKAVSNPPTPTRHTRIPSTGNRATVMDVAQALRDQQNLPQSPLAQFGDKFDSAVHSDGSRSPTSIQSTQAERRKSTYEKYPSPLPPLREEKTPAASPVGTLARSADQSRPLTSENAGSATPVQKSSPPTSPSASEREKFATSDTVHFHHVDEPLPDINIDALIEQQRRPYIPNPDVNSISTDVMSITGTTANTIKGDNTIFYETEVLAIIYRSKSKSTGLVSTKVWGWQGKQSALGEREERKLQELAKRYGTTLDMIHQHSEPEELVSLLGGQLAIRQGTRARWSSENTAMHLVRSINDQIYIDEHDLNIKNLCSGFSYCISILNSCYVWYGCGSTMLERDAATRYCRSLTKGESSIVELHEGEDDQDEMFWMMLGDDDYAKADHWKWRRESPVMEPRIWRVGIQSTNNPVQVVSFFSSEPHMHDSIYVLDCVWEYFVLIGENARANRQDIRLAISIAMSLSSHVAKLRPFSPTVHTLILPSRLPSDLRLRFRHLDEELINNGTVPDHMNILSYGESLEHLCKTSWDKALLRDQDMLPLGLRSSIP